MGPLVVDEKDSARMVGVMVVTSVRPVPLRRYLSCRGLLPVVDCGEPGNLGGATADTAAPDEPQAPHDPRQEGAPGRSDNNG